MNDIFKLFKKRAQSGKSTNITDVIKDLNESEKDEIGKFDRGNKSYLSISKSGRLKSKKTKNSRIMNDDFFNPGKNIDSNNNFTKGRKSNHNECDQHSDNFDSVTSSTSSSFRSSMEEIDQNNTNQQMMRNFNISANNRLNQINCQKKF
ncbi:hypothetical protein BpHYR1_044804 [Brachionus plicatilis]|uniref:Uncharacterized protein n=1 Tax=Brachionus plicatilis TaxID=10195 RepID=A0A3M7QHS7_BRAPC|nr:hypothetical protein BpHYR1_044804 [Brachionus plicatilis]